ncbi:hypothetical protein OFO27_08305 [Campylobacter sp. CS_ED1]|uniref:hypothetical protein n=1 Tax=Campylobacter sp. CS_ED1 TaxID=2984140 RepID=UPI0022E9B5F1|nr:hypothetical protein [Campylobacter sp. CS_ED1]MDA3086515.1 hypothetical protein [Campylobacter sp. CS_ED1]
MRYDINNTYNKKKKQPSDDRYHIGILILLLVLAYWINSSFGFDKGTVENGCINLVGLSIWGYITLKDYFDNRV